MRTHVFILMITAFFTQPAEAKSCAVKNVDGKCVGKSNVEPIYTFKRGTPYTQVRKTLMASGYRAESILDPDPNRCPPGWDECKTYWETISCSGTGRSGCEFMFMKGRNYYAVRTYGEDTLYEGARAIGDSEIDKLTKFQGN